ncbi:two-component system sensor histidine kinase MtrB [Leucobacter luti]|uniref:Sensor histidine kinase MtrB n=1 Tax=Leucobacter luti TaxID=340320 RepID=A0A4R6S6W9_9MICO|nr:MtrAB system histidine kinase MtrB [Leucobacter luti]MCW2288802.1 two-component system sensor histidine kinase MtrB [Leucobacter luti]TCK45046.1 two-component system sensor histidine kinase MtrB [Leucobacter luti]TDP95572.1 two-component system sensor histidine kinase MtrB [Leucobacter luti]
MSSRRSRFAIALRRLRLRWTRWSEPVLGPFRARWRRSLMVRTMTITGIVTGFMVLIAGVFILTSIGSDLYTSRKDAALQDSARATIAAQRLIDAYEGAQPNLVPLVRRTVQDTSSSQLVYLRREPGQAPAADAPPATTTADMLLDAVSPELTEAVASASAPQHWQAVGFTADDGTTAPGILVASTLEFPAGAGTYDLFIGYNLADTQATLSFVQRTLLITAAAMMAFIGILVWIMSRIVFRPLRAAAAASRRLAAGESDARMPQQNDEHFDVLSEGFNDMADTLQARIQELDTLSEMQQRFVSDVSHELRTPLTTIRLASEVLQGTAGGLPPGQQRAVEVLGTQVERFELLLGDLLEISRYDAGRVTLETEQTHLVGLAEEVVDGLRPLSPSEIEVRALGGYAPIEVDPRRIRRIVSNLVGNAIEHGEGGPIQVTIDSNAAAVAISVRDSGVGMATADLEHVFDRFWRADPSRKRTLGGTGLGLAIAQEDAAVHGGILEAWSRTGIGSNFRLTLPRGEHVTNFVSPLPLVPEGVETEDGDPQATGGWLRRPGRRIRKDKRR